MSLPGGVHAVAGVSPIAVRLFLVVPNLRGGPNADRRADDKYEIRQSVGLGNR
jgi:hypothetical protein